MDKGRDLQFCLWEKHNNGAEFLTEGMTGIRAREFLSGKKTEPCKATQDNSIRQNSRTFTRHKLKQH